MNSYINYNGKLIKSGKAIIRADNRGFKYGDGLFETMIVLNNQIRLALYHFERLFEGLRLLEFERPDFFTAEFFKEQILSLCERNSHERKARVRLMIFRGQGGLYNPENLLPNYVIETWQLQASDTDLNKIGLKIDVYQDARKSIDSFSQIKSNNYLPYLMAALYARKHQLDDCLLMNSNGNICEATIANLFVIKGNQVLTPPLSEGCVAGVMRRYLLNNLAGLTFSLQERPLDITDLANSDEVFLTNAVQGIRWVQQYKNCKYGHSKISGIYNSLLRNVM